MPIIQVNYGTSRYANDIYATCTDQKKNMTKASNILQNAQDQMKVILEVYGDEFINFEDEEICILL